MPSADWLEMISL